MLESTLEAIMSKVDLSDTLIVVTADHSHVMTMGGLATPRGNDILGTCNFIPTQYCATLSNIRCLVYSLSLYYIVLTEMPCTSSIDCTIFETYSNFWITSFWSYLFVNGIKHFKILMMKQYKLYWKRFVNSYSTFQFNQIKSVLLGCVTFRDGVTKKLQAKNESIIFNLPINSIYVSVWKFKVVSCLYSEHHFTTILKPNQHHTSFK